MEPKILGITMTGEEYAHVQRIIQERTGGLPAEFVLTAFIADLISLDSISDDYSSDRQMLVDHWLDEEANSIRWVADERSYIKEFSDEKEEKL